MGIDQSSLNLLPNYDFWSRSVTITPLMSAPASAPYVNRGIYESEELSFAADDGTIVSSQRTILDIRDVEYTVIPAQGDLVTIDADDSGPALGTFEIIDYSNNGGGETTLTLRKIETRP